MAAKYVSSKLPTVEIANNDHSPHHDNIDIKLHLHLGLTLPPVVIRSHESSTSRSDRAVSSRLYLNCVRAKGPNPVVIGGQEERIQSRGGVQTM